MTRKRSVFHPSALEVIRLFDREVRLEVGFAIGRLELGETLSMPLSKPMPAVGPGAHELRVKDAAGAYRVFYATKYNDEVWVFHAFTKKTQKTPPREHALAKKRLGELIGAK